MPFVVGQPVPVLDVLGRVDLLHDPEAVDLLLYICQIVLSLMGNIT
jgi:hypothetical protein